MNPVSRCRLVRFESLGGSGAEKIELNKFLKACDETLEEIGDAVDTVFQSSRDLFASHDVILTDGVLTIEVDQRNIYVINRQTPNRQLWLSSPLTGPRRFDLKGAQWIDTHSELELKKLLSEELTQLMERDVEI